MDLSLTRAAGAVGGLTLGRVRTLCASGVLITTPDELAVWCGILDNTDPYDLHEGDEVLVWQDGIPGGRAVVMGRIRQADQEGLEGVAVRSQPDEIPDELVIEARKSLTLRVGDGSITLREDGRIVIKGKDLVSHARGMNRIRGGSVAIN